MSITFDDARNLVGLPSLQQGFEDDNDYNVLLADPLWDQVVLVSKSTGTVRREVYFEVLPRLKQMQPVHSQHKRGNGPT